MIKFPGVSIFISEIPNEKELNKLSTKQLFSICILNNIGLKKVLIDYLMTKKKLG